VSYHRLITARPPAPAPFARVAAERANPIAALMLTDPMTSKPSSVMQSQSQMTRIAMCVVGVVGSLIVYGILQERIMTRPYGVESEYFKYSVFLVLSNRVLSASLAAAILAYTKGMVQPAAPIWKYAGVSASNVLATTCQYEALRYVSFPVQTLGKCAKMIPVMIWGYFINQRRYTLNDYVIASCVTLGCTIFALYGDLTHKHSAKSSNTSAKGLMLMLGYLGFDGFTSTFQDKLFKGYQMETYNQMLYVNGVSACLSVAWLLSDGAIWQALEFIARHPAVLSDIITLSLSSMFGQLCILYTIKEFGALLFAAIMTTRQLLSILLSCVLFLHPLTWQQWCGTALVFSALYAQAYLKNAQPR
jgi:adenosine 3'-phospho 5'-phosphosulfate transporter B2